MRVIPQTPCREPLSGKELRVYPWTTLATDDNNKVYDMSNSIGRFGYRLLRTRNAAVAGR
jgi:hypothetical protein